MINYVVITPVRNEEKYIGLTINSMIHQTILPREWVIVDDGSTDATPNIIDQAANQYSWIKAVHRPDRGFRKTGWGVIEAFYDGYSAISCHDWDFIVKLDGDLSFETHYFHTLFQKFSSDMKLGIASGVYFEIDNSGNWKEVVMPYYHAAGASKVLRRECFEQIRGFIPEAGWDTVDEIRAITCGWTTRHFRDAMIKHHKPEGSGIGLLKTSIMHGQIYYRIGGSAPFFVLKVFHRLTTEPYILNALALFWGYVKAFVHRETLLVTERERACYRDLLSKRFREELQKFFT